MNELILTDDMIIGKGRDRVCYAHPDDLSLCIKITTGSPKQSLREKKYFSYLLNNHSDLQHLSVFRGEASTNLGTGYLFDMIRDYDNAVSGTLKTYLETQLISFSDAETQLTELKQYLITNNICVRDISPSNVVCQKNRRGESFRMMIIDGVSNASVNPLTIRWPLLTKRAISKSWDGIERKIQRIKNKLETST